MLRYLLFIVLLTSVCVADDVKRWDDELVDWLDKGYEIKTTSTVPFGNKGYYLKEIILQKRDSWVWCVNEIRYTWARQNGVVFPDLADSGQWGCRESHKGDIPVYGNSNMWH